MSYQAWTNSNQANSIALQGNSIAVEANKIANSAYSVVNNYPPYIDVSSNGPLILRLIDCAQGASNVTCRLGGTFRINFTIIAPHLGLANVSSVALAGIGPFSQRAHYQVGAGPESVQVGNATILVDPPMHVVSSTHATILAAQPVEGTVEASVSGLSVILPSASLASLDVTGFCALTVTITYWDIQSQSNIRRSLVVQAQIILVPP